MFPCRVARCSEWSDKLFDVLAYLVENYFDDRICPDPDALELKLKIITLVVL